MVIGISSAIMSVDRSPHIIILPWYSFIKDRSRKPHVAHKLPFVGSLPRERIREHHDERIIYGRRGPPIRGLLLLARL